MQARVGSNSNHEYGTVMDNVVTLSLRSVTALATHAGKTLVISGRRHICVAIFIIEQTLLQSHDALVQWLRKNA
jgi:hypothetical protein